MSSIIKTIFHNGSGGEEGSSSNNNNNQDDLHSRLVAGVNEQPKAFATKDKVVPVSKDSFDSDSHFYPKTINAQVSEIVSDFMMLGNSRILKRYLHLNPQVDEKHLTELLSYKPKFFHWSGADLFNVTNSQGLRKMVLIETNSCPSGQKSMPVLNMHDDHGGYRTLIEKTFKPMLEEHEKQLGSNTVPNGKLAVIYDKNKMETSGYAATMADVFGETVYLVEYLASDKDPPVRFVDNGQILQIRDKDNNWINIRGCFRYVTQRPWDRLPVSKIRTMIMNPVICCLAGGRNKLLAAKAYDFLNSQYNGYGIRLNTPRTIRDVEKKIVPIWVESFGGYAVVKNPYSNGGQGVWTITSPQELEEFMKTEDRYDQFIVQSLIGNSKWSSHTHQGQLYHVGTVPDSKRNIYVADLRMMIMYDFAKGGFSPVALYARKAKSPLTDDIEGKDSWDMLGTNLSIKLGQDKWDTDQKRLIICDRKDFSKLGLGVDNLIDAFIQTVLATVAIDKLATRLITENQRFDRDLFFSLNRDDALLHEICRIGDEGEEKGVDDLEKTKFTAALNFNE
nr:unnamed protein product [Naegleria fowleri]